MQEVQIHLPVGSVIRDRYIIEALLGQGGFGAVYRVRDQRVKGNLYALKEVIEPKRKECPRKEKNHFHLESDLLKQLDHRALPRVYRVFDDEVHERAYMLMDFIDGPNLEVLRQQQPAKCFSLSQVLILMEPVVDAISYLHSQQPPIIHRDIKPSNIIVPEPQEAVLVDFDIAKEFDPDSTTTAVRRCSPGYGAPEQYTQGTSQLTDIYGLGATIYTLLSGQIPPDAMYRMTILGAKGHDPLVPLDELVPNISHRVAEGVQQAMSLHQSDRFPTIEQFWHELDGNATSLEVPALVPGSLVPSSVLAHSIASETPSVEANKERPVTPLPPVKELSTDPLASATMRKGRKKLAILLVLLALVICLGSAVGFWTLTEHPGKAFISYPTPTLSSQATLLPTATLPLDPTAAPTGISGKNVSTSTPIVSAIPPTTPVVSHPYPTPIVTQSSVPPTPTPTPTPRPTPTPVPDPYPTLAGVYHGTIVDTTPSPNISTGMHLYSVKQNKGSISGTFTVDAPLQGNGPFSGSVGTNKYIQFTVRGYNGGAPLYFWGFVQSNSSLQGQYCSLDSSGHCSANVGAGGYWDVVPGS